MTKFKVGDKVRVVASQPHYSASFQKGDEGTVTTAYDSSGVDVHCAAKGYAQILHPSDIRMIKPGSLTPLAQKVRAFLRQHRNITAMDAMRSMGLSSGSLTRRLTELRDYGETIVHSTKRDPLTGRAYGVWRLKKGRKVA